jgi:DNA-binding CsgD family transcriptional regulator
MSVDTAAASVSADRAGPSRAAPGTQWPLVGRAEELDFVWDALRQGEPGVVLSGPPGVGKTRLARHVAELARNAGWAVDSGAGTEAGRQIPFGAVAALTPQAGDGAPWSTVEMLAGFVAGIRARAAGRPALLVIDDVHLIDAATATLVGQLCAARTTRVLLTVRRGHPVLDSVVRLWKDRTVRRLELQPLGQDQLVELLTAVLGGVVDTPTRRLLWRGSGGNVFLLRELVHTGLDSGRLSRDGGVWHWDGPLDVGASATELVASHLDRLSEAERRTLELIALGDPLDLAAATATGSEEELISLERGGLIATAAGPDGRWEVRLAHPLYGEGIRNGMPVLAARAARRTLARIIEQAGMPGPQDALRVAVWRLDSGLQADVGLLLRGGRQARALADHRLCERLARAATQAAASPIEPDGTGRPAVPDERFEAHLLLAGALSAQGRWQEAEAECTIGPLADPGDAAGACRVALIRAEVLFWGFGRAAEAMALLESAAAAATGDTAAECQALRGTLALFTGRLPMAAEAAQTALHTPGVSRRSVVRAVLCLVPALALAGHTDQAIAQARRAEAEFAAGLDAPAPWRADLLIGHTAALRAAGELRRALELAEAQHRSAIAAHDPSTGSLAVLALGSVALDTGDVTGATARLAESAALLRRFDQLGVLPWCLALLVRAASVAGQFEQAERVHAELESLAARTSPLFGGEIARAGLWAAVAAGDRTGLARLGARAAAVAESLGQRVVQAAVLHDLVRLGHPGPAATGLTRLARECDGPLISGFAAHAGALRDADGHRLDAVAADFARLGARLLAAEASAQAAAAHHARGLRAAALVSARLSEEHRSTCPGARTPALAHPLASPLTAREYEVAVLAGRGLANTEIAARLHLSVRTVEGYLQQVYVKLDVHRREDLPQL